MNKLVAIFIFLLFSTFVGAQQPISGRVMGSDRIPILGAYIMHLPSEQHTHSNESGNFSLEDVRSGDSLQVMHLGFQTKFVFIKDFDSDLKVMLSPTGYQLDEILVGQLRKNVNVISRIDLATDPVNSSQEVLRKVPGLFIGQHAGGGKAEQIFLRGFDIDHGTDVNLSVEGLPVNMVSHAHGQGYADLHFVIPETIEKIDFGKGPYFADRGNFATAGYVDFRLKEKIEESSIGLEVGQFNTIRNSALINLLSNDHHNLYLAGEYLSSDGPFESPQDFRRLNVMGKYTFRFHNQDKISLMFSRFSSRWSASGQIPVRAVESGLISRFGAIDDTEGGYTDRTNVVLTYNKNISSKTLVKNTFYYSNYNFDLYSNFTFFLEDPVNSDQIRQQEGRNLFGLRSEFNHSFDLGNSAALFQGGIGLRNDVSRDNELARTRNRDETLEPLRRGNIDETNYFGYLNLEVEVGRMSINPGVRLDVLDFSYEDQLAPNFSISSHTAARVSPKLNIVHNHSKTIQFFAQSGIGYHSNDSRIVLEQPDRGYLPAAYGLDLGIFWKPVPRMIVNAALWMLHSEQEFVYVGDAGVVEPSGRSRRRGFDLGIRYQIADWLLASTDLNYADPRALDEPEGNHYIPLAPTFTSVGGIYLTKKPWTAGINYRYLSDRPANEDNSIVADGYFVADANVTYRWRMFQFGLSLENIFDTEWNEAQFATESRLRFETESVEEIHFTPGTPRFLKASIKFLF